MVARCKFLKMVNAITLLQTVFRAWLKVRQKSACVILSTVQVCDSSCGMQFFSFSRTLSGVIFSLLIGMSCLFNHTEMLKQSETYKRYAMLFIYRRSFLRLKSSAQIIQKAVRSWLYRRHKQVSSASPDLLVSDMVVAAINVQKLVSHRTAQCRYFHQLDQREKALTFSQPKVTFHLQTNAAIIIQLAWKKFMRCKSTKRQHLFATKIQRNFRRWLLRKSYLDQIQAVIKIQSYFRMWRCVNAFHLFKIEFKAAVVIQSYLRCWFARKNAGARRNHLCATKIQLNFRRWLSRKSFLNQIQAVIKIQSYFRMWRCVNAFQHFKIEFKAAVVIQSCLRGWFARKDACTRRKDIVEIQVRQWLACYIYPRLFYTTFRFA